MSGRRDPLYFLVREREPEALGPNNQGGALLGEEKIDHARLEVQLVQIGGRRIPGCRKALQECHQRNHRGSLPED